MFRTESAAPGERGAEGWRRAAPLGERDVDFVVVGFGLGALGILLGVVLLGWLAGRTERAAAAAPTSVVAAYDRAAAAECRGAGQAFLYAGGAVILATVGGLAGALDDRTGAFLIATTATVGALGILFWGYLYRTRNPMPPRPRRQPRSVIAVAATAVAPPDRATPPLLAPDAVLAAATAIVPSDSPEPAADSFPAMTSNGEHDVNVADEATAEADIQSDTETPSEAKSRPSMANLDAHHHGASDAADPRGRELEPLADNHATVDAMDIADANVVAVVAPGARAGVPRASISDDDEDGPEPRRR